MQARYAEAAGLLFGKHSLDLLPARLEEWNRAGGIARLGAYGLAEEDLSVVAAQALESSSMKGNPVTLSASTLEAILRVAL